MTRDDVLNNWEVTGGIITSLGKFEREPLYVPALFDLALDGRGAGCKVHDEYPCEPGNEPWCCLLAPPPDFYAQFPEADGIETFHLWGDEMGFVCAEDADE